MPSSYQQRVNENKELIRKNKLLQEELNKMRNAIAILNDCIFRMNSITEENDLDLKLQFEELCKEMEEDKKNKIYIKRGQQLGLPNEKFYEVPWDASDEMLLDIQNWWEGKN